LIALIEFLESGRIAPALRGVTYRIRAPPAAPLSLSCVDG
jgi:hypothetical protein